MNPIPEREKYDARVGEWGWTIFAIKVKVPCPLFTLARILPFPYVKRLGVIVEDK